MAVGLSMTMPALASVLSLRSEKISWHFADRLITSITASSRPRRVVTGGLQRSESRRSVKKDTTKSRDGHGTGKKFTNDRRQHSSTSSSITKKGMLEKLQLSADSSIKTDWKDDEDSVEDPFEKLFMELEHDLEAGWISDDEEITESDLLELENELTTLMEYDEAVLEDENEFFSKFDDRKSDKMSRIGRNNRSRKQFNSRKKKSDFPENMAGMEDGGNWTLEDLEEEEEEQRVVTLEPWQLKKLAAAAQLGRRHANIKALSAEVGMDRSDVLVWLKDPPPDMLMYSATLEEEDSEHSPLIEARSSSSAGKLSQEATVSAQNSPEGRRDWQSHKRLKKVHIATFERVFRKTTRPSDYMVQNIVDLTHVPRKRIVGWFEERRKEVKPHQKFDPLISK